MKKRLGILLLGAAILAICGWLAVSGYQGKTERVLYERWQAAMLPEAERLVGLYAAFDESGSGNDLEALIQAYDSAYENTKNIFEGGGMINLMYIAGWLRKDYPVWQKQAFLLALDEQNRWLYQGLMEEQPVWMLQKYQKEYENSIADILFAY